MKRTMSILLALSLLLLLFSIPAGAESNGEDELFSVARAAFPEYASKIHMNYGSTVQSIARQSGVLIVSETKQLNENQQISYQEYSNGAVVLALLDSPYNASYSVVSSSSGSGYAYRKVNIKAVCNYGTGTFWALGVEYTTTQGGEYTISNTGSLSSSTTTNNKLSYSNLHGQGATPAYVSYYAMFGGLHDCTIMFTVGSSGAHVTAESY